MTVSASRTIIVGTQSVAYGVVMTGAPLRWPVAQPGENLDYSLDITAPLTEISDTIAEVSACVSPSGAGELVLSSLGVTASVITLAQSGGVAARDYTIKLEATTALGRVFVLLVHLLIDPELAADPVPDPPSPDFGAPVIWVSGATVFDQSFSPVDNDLTATGSTQDTALLVAAQTNIITTGGVNTGVKLCEIIFGTIVIQNSTTTDKYVWPPDGAKIIFGSTDAGIDNPIVLFPGARISFSTANAAVSWAAG